jgi:hypothetical protein
VTTTVQLRPLLLLFLLSSSCITLGSLARRRASNEFKCPEEQVVLHERPELSIGTYDVEACGHRARYTCSSAYKGHSLCAREPIDEAPAKQ